MKASDVEKTIASRNSGPLVNVLCDANAKRVSAGVVRYTDTKIELTEGARASDPMRRRTAMDDEEPEESDSDEEPEENGVVAKVRTQILDAAGRPKVCHCCGHLNGQKAWDAAHRNRVF